MEPRTYETSADMRGDPGRVLDALVIALAGSGFRVERRAPSEVVLAGPSPIGTHRNMLIGASRILARASARRLVITAELGGIERVRRFMLLIPLWICLSLAAVLGVVLPLVASQRPGERGWIVFAPMIPFVCIFLVVGLVVRPVATRMMELRTKQALDALAISVGTIGADR